MSEAADLMARIEAAAADELAAGFVKVSAAVMRTINSETASREAQGLLCQLLMVHAARVAWREIVSGAPLDDGEKWRLFTAMLPDFVLRRAEDAVRKLVLMGGKQADE